MDGDAEEGSESVRHFPNEYEKTTNPITDKLSANEEVKERSTLSENVPENVKGAEADSGDEFEDALENCSGYTESGRKSVEAKEENDNVKAKDESPEEETLSPEQKEERKTKAMEYKDKGNDYFKRSVYPEAREDYTMAINICPNCFTKEKSIFYANRAACLVKMDLHKEAAEDCTKALELNTDYIKARLRRAQCYEREDRLEEALEDYQKVFDADRSSHVAREALMRLPEQIRLKHEKMKEEMIGKLKELGNVVLRPFGLSTDNFKFQQDPDTGGYSVNFQK